MRGEKWMRLISIVPNSGSDLSEHNLIKSKLTHRSLLYQSRLSISVVMSLICTHPSSDNKVERVCIPFANSDIHGGIYYTHQSARARIHTSSVRLLL
jgi:hypothetical protein